MSEEGFFGRMGRGVKNFFKSAIASLPTSLLVSGASIGISAALGQVNPDMDFLSIGTKDAAGIGMRFLGATAAGMAINGGLGALQGSGQAEQTEQPGPSGGRGRTRSPERSTAMDITPPSTPYNARDSRART